MTNGRDFGKIIENAREHYLNIKEDITKAKDRSEHIRLTALAQEAHNLLTDLLSFEVGLVYSHTGMVSETSLQNSLNAATVQTQEEPLDLPEFKSPYDPRNL